MALFGHEQSALCFLKWCGGIMHFRLSNLYRQWGFQSRNWASCTDLYVVVHYYHCFYWHVLRPPLFSLKKTLFSHISEKTKNIKKTPFSCFSEIRKKWKINKNLCFLKFPKNRKLLFFAVFWFSSIFTNFIETPPHRPKLTNLTFNEFNVHDKSNSGNAHLLTFFDPCFRDGLYEMIAYHLIHLDTHQYAYVSRRISICIYCICICLYYWNI